MRLKQIEIVGFKSFAKKALLAFDVPVTAVVGPNGAGKSNVVEAFRFVLGEQSMKSMRGKSGSDLIFRGSGAKLSRASVSITFNNQDKVFAFISGDQGERSPVLFDEITFTREIYADGTSRYLMNGTDIKLKQMVELLASVNIGTSSHHIISQGEADGILRANARDRRDMLEDALGLKVYHHRIKESEQKLTKTQLTLKEVQSLRRELAPHLRFLEKQVEKIEKGRAIRNELEILWKNYLAYEKKALGIEDTRIVDAIGLMTHRMSDLDSILATLPATEAVVDTQNEKRVAYNQSLTEVRQARRVLESKIARLEGVIEVKRSITLRQGSRSSVAISFAPTEYEQLLGSMQSALAILRSAQSLDESKRALELFERVLKELQGRTESTNPHTEHHDDTNDTNHIDQLLVELASLQSELTSLINKEDRDTAALQALDAIREKTVIDSQQATKRRYELLAERSQCDAELQILASAKRVFQERKDYFDTELREAAFLFGPMFLRELEATDPDIVLDPHDVKRSIDRLKIRLDEHSGIGAEVVTEYESTKDRDAFLARELIDIEASIRNLESLSIELKKILDERFTNGITVINDRFGEFFKTMFGGGSAFLSITVEKKRKRKGGDIEIEEDIEEESESFERGIEVHVSLPEKKVKDLQMLSGGERSLVSIALLFAISQVNPPPFLVLDETDAALDEANSRRYGDMVERLSEYSQLIVVTHNRETMSRARVLYGVTLGADAGSKLLSIKFDEAVKVAK